MKHLPFWINIFAAIMNLVCFAIWFNPINLMCCLFSTIITIMVSKQ